jgi:hypothetical protein
MSANASFWDNPEAQDNTPVIRHAPDTNNYHVPDGDQLGKMRGSKVGRFAVIPAANKDGTSKAFDPTVAGPVHVDPDAPDGGVIFDASTVRRQDINRAVHSAMYAHQAFYQLGTPAPLLGVGRNKLAAYDQQQSGFDVDAGPNPHMPNTYVTPSAKTSETPSFVANGYGGGPAGHNTLYLAQEEQALNPVPPLGSLPPMAAPAPAQQPQQAYQPQMPPQPQPYYPQQNVGQPPPGYYAPPQAYAPPDSNVQAMMAGMVTLQQQVAALTNQLSRSAPPQLPATTGVSHNPPPARQAISSVPVELQGRRDQSRGDQNDFDDTARPIRRQVRRDKDTQDVVEETDDRSLVRRRAGAEDDGRRQTLREVEEAGMEQEGVIFGFESLELPFVRGPLPEKAKKQVIFEIPGAGRHMARFHDIIVSKECIVLVYDTRYEEGQQYEPPVLDNQVIKLHVPKDKKNYTTYNVSSMGFSYTFGVFDHIVLVKHDDEQLDYPDEK